MGARPLFFGFLIWAGAIAIVLAAEPAAHFRVSAVQESQVWIEGGLLDGLEAGMEGEIFYEISVAGRKHRIVPARIRLDKVDDRQSIGSVRNPTGIINVGYHAALVPRPAADLLPLFDGRARAALASGDFLLAKQLYRRILETVPGDPFALQQIRECDRALQRQAELARERRNVPYYRQVVRSYLASKAGDAALALGYVDKILAVLPGDDEALRFRAEINARLTEPPAPIGIASVPGEVASPDPPAAPTATAAPASPSALAGMMLIPESELLIGSPEKATPFWNESPRHRRHIPPFYIDKYEVTNAQYKVFCDATGRTPPSYFKDGMYPPGWERRPAVMVSWIDADAYARWAGKRLPTEVEWEAAAAGLDGRIWPWGNTWQTSLANTRETGEMEPAEVGSHLGDVSPFGVYDMAGNVSEWTADWYVPYPGNSRREREYGQQFKVLRGGSIQVSKEFARAQFRARLPDGFRSTDLGFRCAISASDPRVTASISR